jgi:hypothetical protein
MYEHYLKKIIFFIVNQNNNYENIVYCFLNYIKYSKEVKHHCNFYQKS